MARLLSVALLVLSAGCGLVLDLDPRLDAAAGSDAGEQGMDAGRPDASEPRDDGGVRVEAAVPTDGRVVGGPVVLGGSIGRGSAQLPLAEASAQATPFPWAATRVEVAIRAPYDNLGIDLWGPTAAVPFGQTTRVSGGRLLATLEPSTPLEDGWYCLTVRGRQSSMGQYLDGDWLGSFPSGDGIEGGDFAYAFAVLEGDITGDGMVDGEDRSAYEARQGSNDQRADLDGSGVVNGNDFLIWQRRNLASLDGSPSAACAIASP